jgi:hypothetical protein
MSKRLDSNAEDGVTWFHSYVTPDRKHTFCLYEAPTPEPQNSGSAGAGGAVSCGRRLSEIPPAAGEKHTLHLHLRPKL